jgi:hypothetical protein
VRIQIEQNNIIIKLLNQNNMAQYRKKPMVIEAFKYGIDDKPNWFNDKLPTKEIMTFEGYNNKNE